MSGRTKGGNVERDRRPESGGSLQLAPALALGLALLPSEAFAHASDRGHVLLLPTGYYVFGGACAVAASFLALLVLPAGALRRVAGRTLPVASLPEALRLWTSLAAFAAMLALIAAGFVGSRDPLSNPLPLTVWTLLWIGLTLVQGIAGDLWSWINPWYGPARLLRCVLPPPRAWPERLGYWPAVVLFAAFAWFELIDIAPDDPRRLGFAVAACWLLAFLGMAVFGYEAWSGRAEFLTVFFRLVSRLAILQSGGDGKRTRLALGLPAASLFRSTPLPLSGMLFLLLALASVSFDGFSKTFTWLAAIGINPLEFPGRSAVQGANSLGLLAMFSALSVLFLLCVRLGQWLSGGGSLFPAAGLLVWSLAPIALAFHVAHYLTALLVNGQYALVALSDPFGLGWNLFGTAYMQVGAGIAMGSEAASLLWNLQSGVIVAGHVLGVAVCHGLCGVLHPDPRRAALSELPLTLLMIGYTVFGLWLLSTPTGA